MSVFVVLVTLECAKNLYCNTIILRKIEQLRKDTREAKTLAEELTACYISTMWLKSLGSQLYVLLMGLLTPPMLKEAFEGTFPWSDVLAYMAYLAFLGSISGMAFMSANYPFIFHCYAYTVSAVVLLIIGGCEWTLVRGLRNWSKRQPGAQLIGTGNCSIQNQMV